jgi:beta-amylase
MATGSVITEITVGCGPAGEARYPAYPEGDRRWRFPGVGEFQCYDRYMLKDLKNWARKCGEPEWGHGGPHDAGAYCSRAEQTGFFRTEGGRWASAYGQFFLDWYSRKLEQHVRDMLDVAAGVLAEEGRPCVVRCRYSALLSMSACRTHADNKTRPDGMCVKLQVADCVYSVGGTRQ